MESKKNPDKDVHHFRGLFFLFGLCVSGLMVTAAFEWRSLKKEMSGPQTTDWGEVVGYEPPIVVLREPTVRPPADEKPVRPVNPIIIETDEPSAPDLTDSMYTLMDIPQPVFIPLPEPEPTENVPFDRVEFMPEPVGGYADLYRSLAKNMEYPRQAKRAEAEGKVFVRFVVDTNGALTQLEVVKGIGYGCDEEAVRALQKTKWVAGRQRGKPVRVRMVLPVTFRLD